MEESGVIVVIFLFLIWVVVTQMHLFAFVKTFHFGPFSCAHPYNVFTF